MPRSSTLLSKSMVGGLAGGIPTSEIPKARRAYMEYVENLSGEEQLSFSDFVTRVYKKQKAD